MELILVNVKNNGYAFKIDSLERFIASKDTTPVPGGMEYVTGVIDFESKIIPILSLRKLFGERTYYEEQYDNLIAIKNEYHEWLIALKEALAGRGHFDKALEVDQSLLGAWIKRITTCLKCNNNGYVSLANAEVIPYLEELHSVGQKLLLRQFNDESPEFLSQKLDENYENLMTGLNLLQNNLNLLTNSFERIAVHSKGNITFGVLVDDIDRIISIETTELQPSTKMANGRDYIVYEALFELDKKIITILDFSTQLIDELQSVGFSSESNS